MGIVDVLIGMDCGLCKLIIRCIKINKEQRRKNAALKAEIKAEQERIKQKLKIQERNKRAGAILATELAILYKQHENVSREIDTKEHLHKELTGQFSPTIIEIMRKRLENPGARNPS